MNFTLNHNANKFLFLLIGAALLFVELHAQEGSSQKTTNILFLLDGSASMHQSWGDTRRFNVAKSALIESMKELEREDIRFGLRVFGHTSPESMKDCRDTRLEVPIKANNSKAIQEELHSVQPRGTTPIVYSMEQAAKDFPKGKNHRNIIILITDGKEACKGDPCQTALALKKKGILLKPFVIGMNLSTEAINQLECMGGFMNSRTKKQFHDNLTSAVKRSLGTATTQVNLLDQQKRPSVTNVNLTFYNNFTGEDDYNYYHTFNERGNPDTFYLDPVKTYDITAHTTPAQHKNDVTINPKQHNIISFDAPQGKLKLNLANTTIENNVHGKIKGVVWPKKKSEIINVQSMNKTDRYIIGKYKLEILTLPRIQVPQTSVDESQTTSIEVPAPGLVIINCEFPGYGGLFVQKDKKMKKVYDINPSMTRKLLALQPGDYKIVFRPKIMHQTEKTTIKTFHVQSNQTTTVNLD